MSFASPLFLHFLLQALASELEQAATQHSQRLAKAAIQPATTSSSANDAQEVAKLAAQMAELEALRKYLAWLRHLQALSESLAEACSQRGLDAQRQAASVLQQLLDCRQRLQSSVFAQLKTFADNLVEYWQTEVAARRTRLLDAVISESGWPAEGCSLPDTFATAVEEATLGLPKEAGSRVYCQSLARAMLVHVAVRLFQTKNGLHCVLV